MDRGASQQACPCGIKLPPELGTKRYPNPLFDVKSGTRLRYVAGGGLYGGAHGSADVDVRANKGSVILTYPDGTLSTVPVEVFTRRFGPPELDGKPHFFYPGGRPGHILPVTRDMLRHLDVPQKDTGFTLVDGRSRQHVSIGQFIHESGQVLSSHEMAYYAGVMAVTQRNGLFDRRQTEIPAVFTNTTVWSNIFRNEARVEFLPNIEHWIDPETGAEPETVKRRVVHVTPALLMRMGYAGANGLMVNNQVLLPGSRIFLADDGHTMTIPAEKSRIQDKLFEMAVTQFFNPLAPFSNLIVGGATTLAAPGLVGQGLAAFNKLPEFLKDKLAENIVEKALEHT